MKHMKQPTEIWNNWNKKTGFINGGHIAHYRMAMDQRQQMDLWHLNFLGRKK